MITVNIEKAKVISHDIRRAKRAEELKPFDDQVNWSAGNPQKIGEAEAQRQAIRDKYAVVQNDIDAAADETALRQALTNHGLI